MYDENEGDSGEYNDDDEKWQDWPQVVSAVVVASLFWLIRIECVMYVSVYTMHIICVM